VIQRPREFGSELQKTAMYDLVYMNYDDLEEVYARHVIGFRFCVTVNDI
jgi:hypothetical protein